MNLAPLFEAQKELDERIVKEKGLQGQDLLDKKILALQVELGELANEWREWKFWSEDREPNTLKDCEFCHDGWLHSLNGAISCDDCGGTGKRGNPVLEEYADCLHFILSIGNEIDYQYDEELYNSTGFINMGITHQFLDLFHAIAIFSEYESANLFKDVILYFLVLGEMLGFTWEQIEQAYFAKNKINHERQTNGY